MVLKTFFLGMFIGAILSSPVYAQSLLVCNATAASLFGNSDHGWRCYEYSPESFRFLRPKPTISSLLKDGWKFSTMIQKPSPNEYIIIFVKE
jgi:hypothetical protein